MKMTPITAITFGQFNVFKNPIYAMNIRLQAAGRPMLESTLKYFTSLFHFTVFILIIYLNGGARCAEFVNVMLFNVVPPRFVSIRFVVIFSRSTAEHTD